MLQQNEPKKGLVLVIIFDLQYNIIFRLDFLSKFY